MVTCVTLADHPGGTPKLPIFALERGRTTGLLPGDSLYARTAFNQSYRANRHQPDAFIPFTRFSIPLLASARLDEQGRGMARSAANLHTARAYLHPTGKCLDAAPGDTTPSSPSRLLPPLRHYIAQHGDSETWELAGHRRFAVHASAALFTPKLHKSAAYASLPRIQADAGSSGGDAQPARAFVVPSRDSLRRLKRSLRSEHRRRDSIVTHVACGRGL